MKSSMGGGGCFPTGRHYPGIAHLIRVAAIGVAVHAFHGRPDVAERWALTVESTDEAGPMPDGSPTEAWLATARALLARNGVEQMRVDAEQAVDELTPSSPWRAAALLFAGVAVEIGGDL